MPGKTSGFFRFFRLQRKTKTESFCRNMCAAKIHRPAHRGAHASDHVGPQQKPSFLSEKEKQTERYPVSPQAETDEAQFVLTRRWGVRRRASSPPKSLRSSSPCSSSRRGPWWTRLHSCEYTGPWRRQASPSRWRPSARYSSQSASRGRRTPCRWGSG